MSRRACPATRQPAGIAGPSPRWLARRLVYLWGAANGLRPGIAGAEVSKILNLVDGGFATATDPNNQFEYADGRHGVAGRNTAISSAGALIYTPSGNVLNGATAMTLLAWFEFRAADDNAQWMSFRQDNQHTLDVFSKTATSVTWGADWAGAWTGSAQQTLSGLADRDFVCIGASISATAARFFANGRFSGVKSGSPFTVSGSTLQVARGTRARQYGAAAFTVALDDSEMVALTLNPFQLHRETVRRRSVALPAGTTLAIADVLHAHAAEVPALGQVHQLATADTTHAQTAEAIAIAQTHQVAIADAMHAHAADALDLSQVHALAVQGTSHGHLSDALTLTQLHLLAVANALHAHAADHIDLSAAITLAIADAVHAHEVGAPALGQVHGLTVADTLHAHSADGLTLAAGVSLVIADALHTHAATAVALGQVHVMVVSDGIHAQLVDAVALSLPGAVLAPERCLLIPAEGRVLVVIAESRALQIAAESRVLTVH